MPKSQRYEETFNIERKKRGKRAKRSPKWKSDGFSLFGIFGFVNPSLSLYVNYSPYFPPHLLYIQFQPPLFIVSIISTQSHKFALLIVETVTIPTPSKPYLTHA
jgi:hypothetical protein